MSKPITKIEITSFRGATTTFEMEFDKDKDLTMLFGENGSGKSSILDAIDVVVNGGVGALEDISVGRNPGQYLCTLGRPQATLRATIHSGQDSWIGTMQSNSISISGPDPRPRLKILRRNRVLKLILAKPQERYNALRRFIDIGYVEQSENNLRQKLRNITNDIDRIIGDRERQNNQLNEVWESENCPGSGQTAMDWAGEKVDAGIAELNTQLDCLKQLVETVESSLNAKNDYSSESTMMSSLQSQLSEIEKKIKDSPDFDLDTAIQLVESLAKVKAYIEVATDLDKCPTCLRPMERDQLLSIVDEQLHVMKDLKTLNDQRNEVSKQLGIATSKLSQAKNTFLEAIKNLQQKVEGKEIPEIENLNIDWPDWTAEEQGFDKLTSIAEQFESLKTGLVDKRDQAQRDVNQFSSIKQWHEGIKQADEEIANQSRILSGLECVYEIVHAKRVAFVQDILDDIAQEANSLFQAIHPSENISLDKLKMDEARSGSVNQTGTHHGNADILPQAVFSESHLDTLGFCVWLALAKRENHESTVLLIDDIFSSADATHLGRVIDLLSIEGPNFLQIIVATHFRLWWDRCQNAQGVQRIQLGQWNAVNGISARDMPLITQQLLGLADSPILDRQAVSSKAGILLESILDGLAIIYKRPLPRNNQNMYTLGDLVGACTRLFSRHSLTVQRNMSWNLDGQPENWQSTPATDAFNRITRLQFIRNQVGCHFNPPGAEIPDDEVREFGRATVDLVNALVCPNCGYLAKKPTQVGTALRCSCSSRAVRMTPVGIA